jgi:hypothetical protein
MTWQRKACKHCQRPRRQIKRGLCWSCYYTPAIRQLYPPRVIQGHGLGCGPVGMPRPTAAWPGTPEKIAVLERRAKDRRQLFHPDDAGMRPQRRAAS